MEKEKKKMHFLQSITHVGTLSLLNVQNLTEHLSHYRENDFQSNKTNSVLHVSAFTL